MNLLPKSFTTFTQNTAVGSWRVPRPINDAYSMTWELMSFNGITTTGKYFYLECPDAARSNVRYSSSVNGLVGTFPIETCPVWFESSPIPTDKTNQRAPFTQLINSPNLNAIDTLQYRLQSDGVITYTDGFYLVWLVTFEHNGSDAMIKPD